MSKSKSLLILIGLIGAASSAVAVPLLPPPTYNCVAQTSRATARARINAVASAEFGPTTSPNVGTFFVNTPQFINLHAVVNLRSRFMSINKDWILHLSEWTTFSNLTSATMTDIRSYMTAERIEEAQVQNVRIAIFRITERRFAFGELLMNNGTVRQFAIFDDEIAPCHLFQD